MMTRGNWDGRDLIRRRVVGEGIMVLKRRLSRVTAVIQYSHAGFVI